MRAALPAAAGTIVVKPGKLDHFVLTAPEKAVAGESFLVRIDPYDANGNLVTESQAKGGTFNLRVSGSAEVLPARLRSVELAGGVTVKVTDKTAEIVELAVLEGGALTPLAVVQVPVYPNKLDHFSLNVPKVATSGEPFQCRIIAQDAFGNTKIDLPDIRSNIKIEFSGTGTMVQTGKQLPPFHSGEMSLSLDPVKVGKVKVLVQEQTTHSRGESAEVEIRPAPLAHFIVQGPKAAVAGEKFSLLLSAMDRNGNVVSNYQTQSDGVLLVPSGDGLLQPPSVSPKEFSSGQARVNVSYTRAEALRITAREMNQDLTGTSEAVGIVAAEPDHFVVSTPDEAVAGESFPVEIKALDRFGNSIEDYDLRGLEVYLSTDGTGKIAPSSVSPSSFVKGKAKVEISYSKAESFSVIAALSKGSLEKIIKERKRRAPVPPAPPPLTPEEIAAEKEKGLALQAREEALKARKEEEQAREEALKAREAARESLEEKAPEPPQSPEPPPAPAPETPAPTAREKEPPPEPARIPLPTTSPKTAESIRLAGRSVQELSQISLIESKGQAMVMLEITGPVSYNASTGSALSKEWIHIELFPTRRNKSKVADRIEIESDLVGDIQLEDLEKDKVKVSLQVLPSDVSYVVSQQDRAVVVKIIKNE